MSSVMVCVAKPPMSSTAARRISAQLPTKNAALTRSLPGWMTEKKSCCSSQMRRVPSFTS